jgi:hypothetical protein
MSSQPDSPAAKRPESNGASPLRVPDAHELRAGATPLEVAQQLRQWIVEGNNYSRHKKTQFRLAASSVRVIPLAMSSAATVILGLQNLNFWSGLGFSLVALATGASSIEAFFNWRTRWIFAEEAQYHLYQLQDELDYAVARRPNFEFSDLDPLYRRYIEVWDRFALQWLEERRRGGGGR